VINIGDVGDRNLGIVCIIWG